MIKLLDNLTSLGLGTSHIASMGRSISNAEASKLFKTALDLNVKVIDTSNTYGSGDSERMISKSVKENRNEFFLITKAGFPHVYLPAYLSPLNQIGKKILQKVHIRKCYSKNYLVSSLEKSLKRLKTDYVDAFLLHEPNANDLVECNDFHEGLEIIKEKGMAKYIGISTNELEAYNITKSRIKLDIVQTSMPYTKPYETSVFNHAKNNDITVVLNQVFRPFKELLQKEEIVSYLTKHIKPKNDLMSILLRYVVNYKHGNCALIGTRNPKHLIENVKGFNEQGNLNEIFHLINSF